MERKWPNTTQSQWHCLDSERYECTWKLAPWTCSRILPWTRWTTPRSEGENDLRYVRSLGLRSRTSFGWLAEFFLDLFSKRFSRQLGLHPLRRSGQTYVMCYLAPSFPWSMLCNNQVRSETWKILTFVLIATKTYWLFPQLKIDIKSLQTV